MWATDVVVDVRWSFESSPWGVPRADSGAICGRVKRAPCGLPMLLSLCGGRPSRRCRACPVQTRVRLVAVVSFGIVFAFKGPPCFKDTASRAPLSLSPQHPVETPRSGARI